jgi:tetratricopeptide (TPR) repeat protein
VQELLQGAAVPTADSAAWAPVLWRHTGGHPLLVLETLRTVLLAQPEGAALGAPPAVLPMPPQVMQLVRQRLAGLPTLAQQVVQVASLAGDAFGPELAAAALAQPLSALGAPWQALQQAGLMNPQGGLHDLVLEAARGTLSAPAAMTMHAAIGGHMAARGAAPSLLAMHWGAAGQVALAAACHEAAAQVAATLSRRSEQIAHWADAARCWQQAGDAERAFKAHAEEAERLITGGDVATGLARAQALMARAVHPPAVAVAHRLHALALLYSGHYDQALLEATRSHAAARATGDTDAVADAVVLRSWAAAALNQRELTEECLAEEQSLPLDPTNWQRAISRRSVTCMALMRIGRLEEALAQNEQCVDWANRPEARSEQMVMLSNSASMLNALARHNQGLERAHQALALAQTLGEDATMTGANTRMHVGLLACSLGRYTEAVAELERCRADLTVLQLPRLLATAQNHLAWLWTVLGQPQRALQMLESATGGLPLVHRLRRWTIRAEMQRLCGASPAGPPPADHEACPDASVAGNAALVLARELPTEARHQRLEALERRFEEREMVGQAMLARVLQLQPLATLAPASATRLALQLSEQLRARTPNTCYWPEAMWEVHLSLKTAGQAAPAQQALAEAWSWVERALAQQVPEPFKESFLRRNRINAAIHRAWVASMSR